MPISASNELKDFDPLHPHSVPTADMPVNDDWLSLSDQVMNKTAAQEAEATHVTSELTKYLSENSENGNKATNSGDDDFWTFFDNDEKQSQTATPCHDNNSDDTVANDNHTPHAVTVTPNETENSIPQDKDMELSDDLNSTDNKYLEDTKDITIRTPSPAASVHNAEENISDDDEQLTGNTAHSSLMTKPNSKLYVARFIKLSPFKCLSPELPRVKIIIVGDANTGKSCFLHKYIHGCFDYQSQPTVGVDICSLPMEDKITEKRLVAQLWDTQGQERFNALTTGYFRGAHGAIIVYDITNYKSLNSIYSWKVEIEKVTSVNPFTHIPTVMVGNKLDLANHRETYDEKDVANKLDIDRCFEVSSKDGRGIDEVVDFLLEEVRALVIYCMCGTLFCRS